MVLYDACTSTPMYHTEFEMQPRFTNSKYMIGAKFKKWSFDPEHAY